MEVNSLCQYIEHLVGDNLVRMTGAGLTMVGMAVEARSSMPAICATCGMLSRMTLGDIGSSRVSTVVKDGAIIGVTDAEDASSSMGMISDNSF